MRKTESSILATLSWIHAWALFGGLYFWLPTLTGFLDKGMKGNLMDSLILLLPIILSYFMLRKIKNLILYLLLSAGAVISLFFMTSHYITVVCSILIFLIRCKTRIDKGRIRRQMREFPGEMGRFYEPEAWEIPTLLDKPYVLYGVLFGVEYFILIFSGEHRYLPAIFYLLFVEVVITVIYRYIEQMAWYIEGHQRIANLPGKMILRNGYAILAVLGILFLIFLIPSLLYGKEPLTALYREHIPNTAIYMEPEISMQEGPDPMMLMLRELAGEQFEPPAWVSTLSTIIVWGIMAFASFFAAKSFFRILGRILGSFAEEEEDEIINLKEVREEQKRIWKEKKKQEKEFRHSPAFRIRKKYKKRILKAIKSKPAGTETPEELEEKAELLDSQDYETLHELYEKARYSPLQCTTEDEKRFPE